MKQTFSVILYITIECLESNYACIISREVSIKLAYVMVIPCTCKMYYYNYVIRFAKRVLYIHLILQL